MYTKFNFTRTNNWYKIHILRRNKEEDMEENPYQVNSGCHAKSKVNVRFCCKEFSKICYEELHHRSSQQQTNTKKYIKEKQ